MFWLKFRTLKKFPHLLWFCMQMLGTGGLWATCLVCAFGAHCPFWDPYSFRAACSNEPITPLWYRPRARAPAEPRLARELNSLCHSLAHSVSTQVIAHTPQQHGCRVTLMWWSAALRLTTFDFARSDGSVPMRSKRRRRYKPVSVPHLASAPRPLNPLPAPPQRRRRPSWCSRSH